MVIEDLFKFKDQVMKESNETFSKFLLDNADNEVKIGLIKLWQDRILELQWGIFILESFNNPELCSALIGALDDRYLSNFLEAVGEDEILIEEELRLKNGSPF